jgi:hypothetical protein
VLSASQSCLVGPRSLKDQEVTLAGKKKTTFAKMNREAKVREKRQARSIRKEQRQREGDAGSGMEHQVEDLSHLDVAFVEGVEPDVTVKR